MEAYPPDDLDYRNCSFIIHWTWGGELPFGKAEWFFGSRHVWRQDRWMVVELLIHCAIWGGWNMDFSGSWLWTWVWGEARGAFGQGQVVLVACMGGNMSSE